MYAHIVEWLLARGLDQAWAEIVGSGLVLAVVAVLCVAANWIAKRVILAVVAKVVTAAKNAWGGVFVRRKVFSRLSHLAPALVIHHVAAVFTQYPGLVEVVQRLTLVYCLLAVVAVVSALLDAALEIYNTLPVSKQHPAKGYVQAVKLLAFLITSIFVTAMLFNREPWGLFSILGGLTAVLLLIFKDAILGFAAGIHLSLNNMVAPGDWIEMPKYGADGDVVDISLTTVKVQNWDKTITMIPAYALISDSFKNWRGMSESGGRRIKRAVHIDMSSIQFCPPEMLERFRHFDYLKEYLREKEAEIERYNQEHHIDAQWRINGRRITNIGAFRAYLIGYLHHHPKIHQRLTFLIRHLQPTEHGLPVEIYVFSSDQNWANYEAIQADIFDHILAVIPEFGLRVFQAPAGSDFSKLVR